MSSSPALTAPKTLILQSHNWQALRGWIGQCVNSVQTWAESNGYDYQFQGDEIFDLLPRAYRLKLAGRMPIQADLARLLMIRDALKSGYQRAVWFDADLLIFAPDELDIDLVTDSCAFGRELWVDRDKNGKLKTWRSLHNAACLFKAGDPTLPFLIQTIERIITKADPDHIAPQMVGPKLLTALDSIAGFGRMNAIAGFSPLLLDDIDNGKGAALTIFKSALRRDQVPMPAAANLCASLNNSDADNERMTRVIHRLLTNGLA